MIRLSFIIILSTITFVASAMDQTSVPDILRNAVSTLYSDPKRSSQLANKALKLCDTSNPDSLTIASTMVYGEAEQLLGNFDLSLRILYDAESMIPENDTRNRAKVYSMQGRVFSKLGDYQRSTELNDKATSMFKSLGDSASVALCYNERGVMLLYLHQYKLAEHFFRRSLNINRKQHNLKAIAKNLNNMCLYEGNPEEKLNMIEEAIAINRNLDSKWSLGENLNNKGKQLYYAGKYNEALAALSQAKDIIDEIEAKELLCDNHEYNSMVYAAKKDYKTAYEYLGKMTALVGELQRNNRVRNTELDLSRKKFEDQRNAAEKQEQEYRIQILHRNIWLILAMVVLVAVSASLYYKRYRHRKNMELLQAQHELELAAKEVDALKLRQQELELENVHEKLKGSRMELTGFATLLKSRNAITDRIKEMIRDAYKMEPEAIVPHLKKIVAYINSYRNNDASGQTMLMSVEERNKEFIERLDAMHPNLTKGEKNLAVLVRGGLASKEIAVLLGLEAGTVNMNRYRLRKSLKLTPEVDLKDYLSSV